MDLYHHFTLPTDQRDHRAGSQLKMAVWLENLTPKPGFNLHLTPTVGLRSMIFSIAGQEMAPLKLSEIIHYLLDNAY